MPLSRRRRGRGEIEIDPNIKLYHGSSVVFERPLADVNALPCDFGMGLYMTADPKRAEVRAIEKAEATGKKAYVLEYDFDDEAALRDEREGKVFIKRFEEDGDWLDYVERHWDPRYTDVEYHTRFDGIIVGPSSDAKIQDVLEKYRKGRRTSRRTRKTLEELELEKYGTQYFFGSQEAIDKYLRYVGKREV